MFTTSGILYNHESPRRGSEFVTRKISLAVAKIKLGIEKKIILGNIEAKRDWGFAGDFVKAMYMMMQQSKPEDYVIGTDKTHTVKEFLQIAFDYLNLNYEKYLEIDKSLFRPSEVDTLSADSSKARKKLGWKNDVKFNELVEMMVKSDYNFLKNKQ